MTANSLQEIIDRIEISRKELLDLGLRNPLVSYRYLRGRGVEATDTDAESVFDVLVRKGRPISFLPTAVQETSASSEEPELDDDFGPSRRKSSSKGSRRRTGRRTRNVLQTRESQAELQRRLLATYYTSNTLLQEQGVNTLFVALGMVTWYEADASDIERRAPLVLVPVIVERESVRGGFTVKYTGEELGANLPFTEKAWEEFRVRLPALHDKEDEDEDEVDLKDYFRGVSQAVKGLPKWSVDTTSVVLGFFSFSKLLMHRDLDATQWPTESGPQDNEIIRALFSEGFSEATPAFGDEERLDDHIHPRDVHHVVDADSSQALAILDVSRGRNLVIQGPPGTGKSQTITNIIAEAIGQGKKVLFVAEKMAALEVVKRRMDDLHLGDACLELHSHKTTKTAVLAELKRVWELGKPNTEGIEDDFKALARVRNELNRNFDAVNAPVGETGVTPFAAYGELLRIRQYLQNDVILPPLDVEGLASWSRSQFEEKREFVTDLQNSIERIGPLKEHPFWGSRLTTPPISLDSLRRDIIQVSDLLDDLKRSYQPLAQAMKLNAPNDISQSKTLWATGKRVMDSPSVAGLNLHSAEWSNSRLELEAITGSGVAWTRLRAKYDAVLKHEAWGAGVEWMREGLSKGGLMPRTLRPSYRRARKALAELCRGDVPSEREKQLELVNAIAQEGELARTIDRLAPVAEGAFGKQWRRRQTDWDAVSSVIGWLFDLYEDIDSGEIDPGVVDALDLCVDRSKFAKLSDEALAAMLAFERSADALEAALELDCPIRFGLDAGLAGVPFDQQRQILSEWSGRIAELQDIIEVNIASAAATAAGLRPVVELAEEWSQAAQLLGFRFEQARYENILEHASRERRELSNFVRVRHEGRLDRFREIDIETMDHNRRRVAFAHWRSLPAREATGQLSILRREFEKKRRHKPIRQLIGLAGEAIQAIKPVFMMSPLSIATYIEPDSVGFDLVVFDEASQVRPVDALGALLRAKKVVVVGDDRQLPPTSFFDSATRADDDDFDDDNVTGDIESILGLMRSAGCPSRMLRWHYRSRHESLIATSNQEFYQNGLVVFPSPDTSRSEVGLQYHKVSDAVYDRGGSRANRREAEEVANAVMEHAKLHPDLTLGVAAFSSAQMAAIRDQVELLRRQDDSCEGFFNAHPEEPFFIKNLENVQGDERDVIFISVGYGRDSNGQLSMNFGPLNREGGERRLNVIITRAKRRCHVFTGLRAEDINLGNNRSPGLRALKTFLAYAESGLLPSNMPVESGRDMDSPFQRAVAFRLRSRGYDVHEEVASGGKFIDLAIVDPTRPGRYLLGIECDGATYHSSMSARDRDRIREQVLIGLGWRLHRIWSTDWFRNEERELDRVVEAIEQAKVAQSVCKPDYVSKRPEIHRSDSEEDSDSWTVPLYELARPRVNTQSYDLSEMPHAMLIAPISEVVSVEAPVHISEVIRRVREAAGVNRTGRRIKQNLNLAIDAAVRGKGPVRKKGAFLWMAGVKSPTVRDRSEQGQLRKIDIIAPEEIGEAVKLLVARSFSIDRQEAVRESAKLLGFKSVSEKVKGKVDCVVAGLIEHGSLKDDDGLLSIPTDK